MSSSPLLTQALNVLEHSMSFMASDRRLSFGAGPVAAYVLGFACSAAPLELLLRRSKLLEADAIEYGVQTGTTRGNRREIMEKKVSIWTQFWGTMNNLLGPAAIINGILSYLLMNYLYPNTPTFPGGMHLSDWNWITFLSQFLLLELIGDFFLYWGHRIQHEIPILWDHCHSVHHSLDTPSPLGTLYIHPIDATLQGALPMMLSILLVSPDLFSCYLYIFLRIAENVVNHSGVESTLLNLISLKFLFGRASVAHHDSHHQYSNHLYKSKNYGENFWYWDYMFGTYYEYPSKRHVDRVGEKKE